MGHSSPPRRQRRLALAVLVMAAVTAVLTYPVRATWWGGWILAIAEAGFGGRAGGLVRGHRDLPPAPGAPHSPHRDHSRELGADGGARGQHGGRPCAHQAVRDGGDRPSRPRRCAGAGRCPAHARRSRGDHANGGALAGGPASARRGARPPGARASAPRRARLGADRRHDAGDRATARVGRARPRRRLPGVGRQSGATGHERGGGGPRGRSPAAATAKGWAGIRASGSAWPISWA